MNIGMLIIMLLRRACRDSFYFIFGCQSSCGYYSEILSQDTVWNAFNEVVRCFVFWVLNEKV